MHRQLIRTPKRNPAHVFGRKQFQIHSIKLVLFHNVADGNWATKLAERIRLERFEDHHIMPQLVCCNFSDGTGILPEAGAHLGTNRSFAVGVSKRMLQQDWPALEKLMTARSELRSARGRFVALLTENVTLPPLLRLQEWIDFRPTHSFEVGFQHLLTFLRKDLASPAAIPRFTSNIGSKECRDSDWVERPLFVRARKNSERIISNLFPVVEIPKDICSAETRFQSESEVMEACGDPGPLPFLLRGSRVYTVAPLGAQSIFAAALKDDSQPTRERFTEWLSDPGRVPWAMELLNRLLRYHGWKRGLRFDKDLGLFYFTRSKPKKLWWEIAGKTFQREVTAAHLKWNEMDQGVLAEVQYGWRHEAIRAGFVQILGNLFLRLEPAWFMTELDGRTSSTTGPVGPLNPLPSVQASNAQNLRALRFWSAVFAKGHRELRIDTGANPIRARLTPACGSSRSMVLNDQLNFESLALMDIDRAQLIPELGPLVR